MPGLQAIPGMAQRMQQQQHCLDVLAATVEHLAARLDTMPTTLRLLHHQPLWNSAQSIILSPPLLQPPLPSYRLEEVFKTAKRDFHNKIQKTLKAGKGYAKTITLASLSTQNANVQQEIVDLHNKLRRNVMPPASNMLIMVWCDEAAEIAQQWANTCSIQHSTTDMRTLNGKICGENLFMANFPDSWTDCIQTWYDEVQYFEYGTGETEPYVMVYHYTQVVWYKSHRIGCAISYCPNRVYKYFYVCHYCPAGNIENLINMPYRSGEPCGDCPNACDEGLCTNPCPYDDLAINCEKFNQYCDSYVDVWDTCPATCLCTTEIK
ncbi:cysteine-rich venom protein-like [Rhinatrema bivittatum]|uniref:cysteine-rich venom protein-like n=1 Tax=Rhinatrema bivittatum TaxID=194408 RepID=UPI00112D1792|nr:cysteine-rich venom protein-like [Rhinatrema bivittatum]